MLSIKEEKREYFPLHSWQDFQKQYVNRLNHAYKSLSLLKHQDFVNDIQYVHLNEHIDSLLQRLNEIDTIIASPFTVDFVIVEPKTLESTDITRQEEGFKK